ncbi:unnamed protein product, partial [Effrenium voratum]
ASLEKAKKKQKTKTSDAPDDGWIGAFRLVYGEDAPLPGPGELTADFLADLAFKLAMKQAEMK